MMTSRICHLAVCVLAMFAIEASRVPQCDSNYEYCYWTEKCYRLCLGELDFHDAEAACLSDGGHLVAVNTEEESQFIVQYITFGENAWMGFIKHYAGYPFDWTTLENVTFTNWALEEPNANFSNMQCAHFWEKVGGKWADTSCDRKLPYVCEKGEGTTTTTTAYQ